MTDDRSAKKAARARMAAIGEPCGAARPAVQAGPGRQGLTRRELGLARVARG
jgi:hypothetical protein